MCVICKVALNGDECVLQPDLLVIKLVLVTNRAKLSTYGYWELNSWTQANKHRRFTSVKMTIINKIIERIFDIWPDSSQTSSVIGSKYWHESTFAREKKNSSSKIKTHSQINESKCGIIQLNSVQINQEIAKKKTSSVEQWWFLLSSSHSISYTASIQSTRYQIVYISFYIRFDSSFRFEQLLV